MPAPYYESERNTKLAGTTDANGVVTPIVSSSGGGGGAVTIADGADTAQGTTTDVAYVSGSGTIVAILKGIFTKLAGTLTTAISGSVAVTGTFFQATQPVSIASGQVVDGGITTIGTEADVAWVSGNGTVIALLKGIFGKFLATQPVSGTVTANAGTGTLAVSIAAAPLPPASVSHAYTTVSVGVASGTLLASNASAKYRMFQNLSTTATVSVAANVTAVLNTQITLPPMSVYEMSLMMGNLDTRAFNAIASAAATSVLVTEGS